MDVSEKTGDLATFMAKQLRVRGGDLADVASRAKRQLPRRLHRDIATLLDAETVAAHPKLAYRVDTRAVVKAERRLRAYLDTKDPAKERRAEFLDRLAMVVFILFAILLVVFFLLISQGYFD